MMKYEFGTSANGRSTLSACRWVVVLLWVGGAGLLPGNELHDLAGQARDGDKFSLPVFTDAVLKNPELINGLDQRGNTPLLYAAISLNLEYARILLAHGANPNLSGPSGDLPLMFVIRGYGGSLNWYLRSQPESPLCLPEAMAELLLKHGAQFKFPLSSRDEPPLMMAVKNDNLAMVRLLLAYGADPMEEFDRGNLALDEVNSGPMAELLLDHMPEYYSYHVRAAPERYMGRRGTVVNSTVMRVVHARQAQSLGLPIFLFWLLGCSILGGWVIRRRRQKQMARIVATVGVPPATESAAAPALRAPSAPLDEAGTASPNKPEVPAGWARQKPPKRYHKLHPVTQARMARRAYADARILLWIPLAAWTLFWVTFFAHPYLRSLGLIDNLNTFGFEAGFLAVVGMCYQHDDRAHRWLPIAGFLIGSGAIVWCGWEYVQIAELPGIWIRALLIGAGCTILLWLALMSRLFVVIRLMHRRNKALGVLDGPTAADAKDDFTLPENWDETVSKL